MEIITILLDTNIYDKLDVNECTKQQLATLVVSGRVRVIAPCVIVDELTISPFRGIPKFFLVDKVHDGIPVAGIAKAGMAIVSDGKVFKEHLGNSKKAKDAVIVHTANNLAEIIVSDDQRCLKRIRKITNKLEVYDFDQFKDWLNAMIYSM